MSGPETVRSSMRTILRHLKKLPSEGKTNKAIHIRDQFRMGKLESSEHTAARMRENAKCYATLVSSISELRHLRSLDSGDKLKPRDLVNVTAKRVGFSIPKFSDELKEQDFNKPLPEVVRVPTRYAEYNAILEKNKR